MVTVVTQCVSMVTVECIHGECVRGDCGVYSW